MRRRRRENADSRLSRFLRACGAALALALCLGLAAAWPASAADAAPGFEAFRGRIVAEAMLEGVGPYPFLLDSCLRRPVLHAGVQRYLGLPLETPPGAPRDLAAAQVQRFALGALGAVPERFTVVDLTKLGRAIGTPVAGIASLHQPGYEVVIDFAGGGVRWRPLARAILDGNAPDGMAVAPMRFDARGRPEVDALIGGERMLPAIIDTMHPGTLELPLGEIARLAGEGTARKIVIRVSGDRERTLHFAGSLAIGAALLEGVYAEAGPHGAPARIGLGALRHFEATLNFEAGRIGLSHPDGVRRALPPPSGAGLTLEAREEAGWRVGVIAGGPAADAGIQPGALLTEVDGWPVHARNAAELEARLFAPPGAAVSVAASAGGREHRVTLTARPL